MPDGSAHIAPKSPMALRFTGLGLAIIWARQAKSVCRWDVYKFRATYKRNELLKTFIDDRNGLSQSGNPLCIERILPSIYSALRRLPDLAKAAQCDDGVRAMILFTAAAFEGQTRNNRPEQSYLHSMRVGNDIACLFGYKAVTPIKKAVGHDTDEDCGVGDALRKIFGDEIADGVLRLSLDGPEKLKIRYPEINAEKFPDLPEWHLEALRKRAAKFAQASKLKNDEQAIKAVDNIDDPSCNTADYVSGLLTPSAEERDKLWKKFTHRIEHALDYQTRLWNAGEFTIDGQRINARSVAAKLEQRFSAVKTAIANSLFHPFEADAAREEAESRRTALVRVTAGVTGLLMLRR